MEFRVFSQPLSKEMEDVEWFVGSGVRFLGFEIIHSDSTLSFRTVLLPGQLLWVIDSFLGREYIRETGFDVKQEDPFALDRLLDFRGGKREEGASRGIPSYSFLK